MSTFSPTTFRHEVASRGLSMRDLSRLSGVHEVSLYRYSAGTACPSSRSLTKLAVALSRVPALPVDLSEKKTATAPSHAEAVTSPEGRSSATATT